VQEYPRERYDIVVVEDGTKEGGEVVAKLSRGTSIPIQYIQIPHSGAATARNTGMARAHGDIVAFIDDDGLAVPGWLDQLVEALQQDGVGGAGGRVSPEYPDVDLQAGTTEDGELKWTGFNVDVEGFQGVDHLPGGNMAFWRKLLLEIRGMDTKYTRRGSWREDTDLCIRIKHHGYHLLYNSKAKILHRAQRWRDPIERIRPSLVWAMTRDDAYFRAKNYGWRGVRGAVLTGLRDSQSRIVSGFANLFLVFVHLFGWIPGAWLGLRKKDRQLGSLPQQ
jgi:GT2 family glycosyltransferase